MEDSGQNVIELWQMYKCKDKGTSENPTSVVDII